MLLVQFFLVLTTFADTLRGELIIYGTASSCRKILETHVCRRDHCPKDITSSAANAAYFVLNIRPLARQHYMAIFPQYRTDAEPLGGNVVVSAFGLAAKC